MGRGGGAGDLFFIIRSLGLFDLKPFAYIIN